ncbi:8-oxo-dGTP diphosphatase [Paenibacillus mucilaginosus]|uniref:MutT/Nudix family hydrolase n=1 Tax=Paenibacillus mucilaginosus (strain KNP414) TaxID=1036673 RepID=F8FPY6_PAEMK|nr:MutT/Nudix family hydrolase [Paenibacillus mucilaginosus KNP414]WDM28147.1 8-oxo-dGTP diphosphatase [Paenibacillus mucilaginosus]
MLEYNVAFLRRGDLLLMLNRSKPPLLGLWNGVGGKLEPGESPLESVLREIGEETGLALKEDAIRFGGIVTWEIDGRMAGGMYAYTADAGSGDLGGLPRETADGILAWKPAAWVLNPENRGVAGHVRYFLPPMLEKSPAAEYRCLFREGQLLTCECLPLDLSLYT